MSGKDKFLLDTNIVLGLLKNNNLIVEFFQEKTSAVIAISQITRMELLGYPGITNEEETVLKDFISSIDVLPITESISDQAILLRRTTRLKLPDAIIAATAIHFDLTLITADKDLINSTKQIKGINPLQSG